MAKIISSDIQTYNNNEFRSLADKISLIAAKYSIRIAPYHSYDLPIYGALSLCEQEKALAFLRIFHESLELVEASGRGLSSAERATWGALSASGLVPPSDLFAHLKSTAVIEIYDLSGRQIWRNFECMKFCSYTLEEIYSIELFHRYKRDPEIVAECMQIISDLLTGKLPELYWPKVKRHELEETCSIDRLILSVDHALISRLLDRNGAVAAWLVMSDAEVIGTAKSRQQKPALKLVPTEQIQL